MKRGIFSKRILFVIFSLIFIISFGSASFLEEEIKAKINQYSYPVPKVLCHTFYYPILKNFYKDFKVEVKTTDTNENFFLVVKENGCQLTTEFIDKTNPDILIEASYETKDYLIKPKSFRGFLAKDRFRPFLP